MLPPPLRADGFGLIFAVAMVIAFINLVKKSQQAAQQQKNRLAEAERLRRRAAGTAGALTARPETKRSGLLEDLERNLALLTGAPVATTVPARRPPGRTAAPTVLDLDEEAEDLVQRRIDQAEARNHAISDADYAAFEKKIRKVQQPVAVPVAAPAIQPVDLRQAIIWNEVLSPPVSLRRQ